MHMPPPDLEVLRQCDQTQEIQMVKDAIIKMVISRISFIAIEVGCDEEEESFAELVEFSLARRFNEDFLINCHLEEILAAFAVSERLRDRRMAEAR